MGLFLGACATRPPQFADRTPVLREGDDRPIAVPKQRFFLSEINAADVYVRRGLVEALDPRRPRPAVDVNSLDEVARSSWYHGLDPKNPLAGYEVAGPPKTPWTVIEEDDPKDRSGIEDTVPIRDARGLRYELIGDPQGRPQLRTGAQLIASRLVYALGYYTPEVYRVRHPDRGTVAALRWPADIDLGPTPITFTREDDPNDKLEHRDRRSLRALRALCAFIQMNRLPAESLHDAYVGKPGRGHVRHYVVGLTGALGVADLEAAIAFANDPDRQASNFFFRLFSMGLSPKPPSVVPETDFPEVGLLLDSFTPKRFQPQPPFEPFDRILPDDEYWFSKTLARLRKKTVVDIVRAAGLRDEVTAYIIEVLERRRAIVVADGLGRTSPLEVAALTAKPDGLVFGDLGIEHGFVPREERSYRVRFLDAAGDELRRLVLPAAGRYTSLSLRGLDEDYVVVDVRARRKGIGYHRSAVFHLRRRDGRLQHVGTTH
ncbi:MAG: hypothetical protein AAGA56_05295 [Myxococcota bacterium]